MKKTAFITGGSRGIGLATAEKFIKEGWQVASFYKNKPGPEITGVKYFQMDIVSPKDIEEAFDAAFSEFKRVDAFVNCVGIFGYRALQYYDLDLLDEVIDTNEKGAYLVTKKIVSLMTGGSIVYVSSTAAQIGSTDPVYAGTKAAMLGLTKSMAKDLAPDIRVNCVAPGVTNSDMTKSMNPDRLKQLIEMTLLKRIAEPRDIANAIYFLASDNAKHITGACLDINGGYVLR
ncbi:SDR family oxidoreductase [Candidatus Woesebacteria bacterium]|nr:SDR family oxidoreductase [Candidatus Woesebacteria bacterium]